MDNNQLELQENQILEEYKRRIRIYYGGKKEYLEKLQKIKKEIVARFGSRIGLDKLAEIDQIPDQLDQMVSLLDAARLTAVEKRDFNLTAVVGANLRELEEEEKRQAEAQLTKLNIKKEAHHPKAQAIIHQIQAAIAPKAPDAARALEQDAAIIETQGILEPQKTVTVLQDFVVSTVQEGVYTPETVAYDLAGVVQLAAPFDPALGLFVNQTSTLLPTLLPDDSKERISDTLTAYTLKNSSPTTTQIKQLFENIIIKEEAETRKVVELPEEQLTTLIANQKWQKTPEELLQGQITTGLMQNGVDASNSSEIAGLMVDYQIPMIINTIAYQLPAVPSESRDARNRNVTQTKKEITNHFLKYLASDRVKYTNVINRLPKGMEVLYSDSYTTTLDYYDSPESRSPQARQFQTGWLGNLANYGKDKALGKATDKLTTSAINSFIKSQLGQKLLGSAALTAESAVVATGAVTGPPGWVVAGITIAANLGKDTVSKVSRALRENLPLVAGFFVGIALAAFSGLGVGAAFATGLGGAAGGSLFQGRGLVKAGRNLNNFFNGLAGTIGSEVIWPFAVIIIATPIVLVIFLFIINTSALVVPVNPLGSQTSGINFIPTGETIECTSGEKPLTFRYDTNPVATAAWTIVNALKQGFWCYWNQNPSRPELFNMGEFQKFPNHCVYQPNNPAGCGGDYRVIATETSMYWCTWLIRDAYRAGGASSVPTEAGANNMKEGFKRRNKYVANTNNVVGQIEPGDAIFLRTGRDSGEYAGHVALVYLVTSDYILTLDSNAATKTNTYTVSSLGKVQDLRSGSGNVILSVIGFGKAK